MKKEKKIFERDVQKETNKNDQSPDKPDLLDWVKYALGYDSNYSRVSTEEPAEHSRSNLRESRLYRNDDGKLTVFFPDTNKTTTIDELIFTGDNPNEQQF